MPNTSVSWPKPAVGIVVIHQGRILLVKRARPPSQHLWAIPGGKINAGETMQMAAEREILEETGLTVTAGQPVHVFDLIEKQGNDIRFHYVIVDLLAQLRGGVLRAADDAGEARWFSHEELNDVELDHNTHRFLQDNGALFCQETPVK